MCAGVVGVEVETLGDAGICVGPVDRVMGLPVVVGLSVFVGLPVVMCLPVVVGLSVIVGLPVVVGLSVVVDLVGISGFENQDETRIIPARRQKSLTVTPVRSCPEMLLSFVFGQVRQGRAVETAHPQAAPALTARR